MVLKRNTLGTIQRIPETNLIVNSVIQPTTHYTCPTGKKAVITGTAVGINTGAGVVVRLVTAGINYCVWETGSTDNDSTESRRLQVPVAVNVTLLAGQTIVTNQDAGANAQIKLFLKILELPA